MRWIGSDRIGSDWIGLQIALDGPCRGKADAAQSRNTETWTVSALCVFFCCVLCVLTCGAHTGGGEGLRGNRMDNCVEFCGLLFSVLFYLPCLSDRQLYPFRYSCSWCSLAEKISRVYWCWCLYSMCFLSVRTVQQKVSHAYCAVEIPEAHLNNGLAENCEIKKHLGALFALRWLITSYNTM